ncbi:pyruvate ferredoxin oxidoreductase [Clostridium fermenticellae]|uniref:Pyruvate ferredoxin oxidoreductase n=1 Tax=Clostridium fermenticellae TaxID=2068654 RepID=A0A386H4P5_9CLOT|nr:2-oxoacid:acceptor oxidoreductase family protein [Clostridium fermenticellae]AYD40528.1 pyruvate ferredoxin oxidoreductase [Clostridium fermenticellae]
MIEIRWHGRGGQGAFTAARLLGHAVSIHDGKYAQAFPSFGPERRGAPVLAFTRISDNKISDRSQVEKCDYVVVLDETLYGPSVIKGLKNNGILVINSKKNPSEFAGHGFKVITIDATELSLKTLKRPITNVPMLGALIAASGLTNLDAAYESIDSGLSPAIREKNKKVLLEAYNSVKEEA